MSSDETARKRPYGPDDSDTASVEEAHTPERVLPDRLSLTNRVQVPCGCIRAVDSVSGLALIEKECGR